MIFGGNKWVHAMEVEASLHPEVKLTIHNANRQAKKQIDDIEKFIADKVDVIIVSPFESDSIIPVIEKANAIRDSGNYSRQKSKHSNYTAYLGADNVEVGRIAGRHIVSLSKGNANVIEIKGASYTSPGLERTMGFRQIIDQYPGVKVISIDAKKDRITQGCVCEYFEKRSPKLIMCMLIMM